MRVGRLICAVLAFTLTGSAVGANEASTSASFDLKLVIEPACFDPADPSQEVAKVVPDEESALIAAKNFLESGASFSLRADHDPQDTGNWIVRLSEAPSSDGAASPVAFLRIEKCTGIVTYQAAEPT